MHIPPALPRSLENPKSMSDDEDCPDTPGGSHVDSKGSDSMSDVGDSRSRDEKLASAASLRTAGNDKLRSGDLAGAAESYEKGLADLKGVEYSEKNENSLYKQLVENKLALNLNLALSYMKQEKWNQSLKASSASLEIDSNNIKGLFRRGVARGHLGLFAEARADIVAVIRAEPSNTNARNELEQIKQREKETKVAEKAAYGNLFERSGGSLYSDVERKVAEEKKRAAEALEKEKKEWEEDMKSKSSDQSFEEWQKEKKRKRELEEDKNKKNNRASPSKAQSPQVKKTRPTEASSAAAAAAGDDSIDLNEEELKILEETKKKGYCYFKTEIDQELKEKLQEESRPKELTSPTTTTAAAADGQLQQQSTTQESSNSKQAISEWNKEGTTYEEMDVSQWATRTAEKHFSNVRIYSMPISEASAEGQLQALINSGISKEEMIRIIVADNMLENELKVESADITGSAEVMVVRGRKRYLYDFSLSLKWELTIPPSAQCQMKSLRALINEKFPEIVDEESKKVSGKLQFQDWDAASTTSGEWMRNFRFSPSEKIAHPLLTAVLNKAGESFKAELLNAAKKFEEEYRNSK